MKTIAIISQKGGAGKTTLSVHLATAASASGHSAAIVDLDPQGTAASWGDRRQADAPEVVSGQAARLAVLIEAARANGDGNVPIYSAMTPRGLALCTNGQGNHPSAQSHWATSSVYLSPNEKHPLGVGMLRECQQSLCRGTETVSFSG
jgi:hypothetical protein